MITLNILPQFSCVIIVVNYLVRNALFFDNILFSTSIDEIIILDASPLRGSKHELILFSKFSKRIQNRKFLNFADQRLNDIVGSAYYVAPEVLHRSYNVEADMWSIGVITYILLCGSRPFWARTESGIFRSVLRADPNFEDAPWPGVSAEARDFVRRLLNKDHRKRMSAAQALSELADLRLCFGVCNYLKIDWIIFT